MTNVVCLRGVEVRRSGRSVLGPLDLDLRQGRITAICGANGSGKTTMLRTIAGRLVPDAGRVLLNGQPVAALKGKELGRTIAVLGQHQERVSGLSVRELVGFGRYPHRQPMRRARPEDTAAVNRALALCLLEPLAERDIGALSGGEQQRAWLALALAQEPEVLLLDEPTSYLDVRHQVELLSLLRRLNRDTGLTIIAVLHDLNQVMRLADDVVLLHGGAVAGQGAPEAVLTSERLTRVFGLPLEVLNDPADIAYVRIHWLGADA